MAKTAPPEPRADGATVVSSKPAEHHHGKKHVRSIRTTRAKGGGHVVEHEFDNSGSGPYHQSAQHVFGKDEGVKHVKHYIRHAGIAGVTVGEAAAAGEGKDAPKDEEA